MNKYVLLPPPPHSSEHLNVQQDGLLSNKKKKCRGNRKLQHFRRKCRAKGMNNQAVEMLISVKKAQGLVHQNHNQEAGDNEEIQHLSNTKNIDNDVGIMTLHDDQISVVDEYPSMMEENSSNNSIIEPSVSLQSIPTEYQWTSKPTTTHKKKTKFSSISVDLWKRSSSKLVPKYSKLPNYLFKHLLSKNISCYCNKILQWLTNDKLLQFIRQRAEFMNAISELNIEHDYWTYILNLGIPAMHWLSTISKNIKQRSYINWDYPRTVENVLHRKNIIENKLLRTQNDLNVCLQQQQQQTPQFFHQMQNETPIDHTMNIISKALVVMIHNGLHKLRTNFEHKKILLQFDVNDVHLVKSFYDLNPTEEQICAVQQIWRTKAKSCKRKISQMKNCSSIIIEQQNSNQFYNESDYQQNHQLFSSIESLDHSIRVIVQTRLENIEQRTQQIIKFIKEPSA